MTNNPVLPYDIEKAHELLDEASDESKPFVLVDAYSYAYFVIGMLHHQWLNMDNSPERDTVRSTIDHLSRKARGVWSVLAGRLNAQ